MGEPSLGNAAALLTGSRSLTPLVTISRLTLSVEPMGLFATVGAFAGDSGAFELLRVVDVVGAITVLCGAALPSLTAVPRAASPLEVPLQAAAPKVNNNAKQPKRFISSNLRPAPTATTGPSA
jgi:hypothetical protein